MMRSGKTARQYVATIGGPLFGAAKLTPLAMVIAVGSAWAHENSFEKADVLEGVEVNERSDNLIGIASTATEGTVGSEQLKWRPLLRPGELIETVPGLILTQHSGAGKANQFYARGFNLDHGTDFATFVDGMPINLPTQGHGQGYTDLNFLIPELVDHLDYKKGPYYASEGDFSSVGAVHMGLMNKLDRSFVETTYGTYDYYRTVFAGSHALGSGNLLGAGEVFYNDGPWSNPDHYQKYNAMIRYSRGDNINGFNVTGMAYSGDWSATDQLARRAYTGRYQDGSPVQMADGSTYQPLSRWGTLDDSTGGRSHRMSLSGEYRVGNEDRRTVVDAYFVDYKFNLFSNFAYGLIEAADNSGVTNQFEQADKRRIYGAHAHHHEYANWFGFDVENVVGLQTRFDDIAGVGLYNSTRRVRTSTVRDDAVKQLSVSPYIENRIQWHEKFRTIAGLRGDWYHYDVNARSDQRNSGQADAGLVSPKLSLVIGPWFDTEMYLSAGSGFHSNDGRGSTIRYVPGTNDRAETVDPLARSVGGEFGFRSTFVPKLQSTLSFFLLDIDSELVFIGDAGNTEASAPSRRTGVEFTNYYTPYDWLTLDADFAFSRARFRGVGIGQDYIPGAVERVIAAGITAHDLFGGFYAALRMRHFGERPLIEDNSVRSDATTLVNASLGYEFDKKINLSLDFFNLLDSAYSDIDYYYPSRLPGEAAGPDEGGWNDIHTHPVEPITGRLTLRVNF